jgi:cell division protein ZipA
MFDQFSNISQQQLILLIGILVILLLLLDALRRTRRKKYKTREKSQVETMDESKEKSDQEESTAPDNSDTTNEESSSSDSDDATVEYKFDPVVEAAESEIEEIEKEPEPETEPEEELPEAKTWEEAVEQKRKMQVKANRSSTKEEALPEVELSTSDDSTLSQGIIALHIMAPRNYVFYGEDLVTVFDHYQLNYSRELQTYQGISSEAEVMFNVTTATKPGTFDPKHIKDLQTPGISFFMDISSLKNPKEQFKQMLSLLYKMNEHLGGMLLNETRSRFTQSDVSRITASIKKLELPETE